MYRMQGLLLNFLTMHNLISKKKKVTYWEKKKKKPVPCVGLFLEDEKKNTQSAEENYFRQVT